MELGMLDRSAPDSPAFRGSIPELELGVSQWNH